MRSMDWCHSLIEKLDGEMEMLERHVGIVAALKEHQPIGIIRLAEILDLPQHKVRYSLRILEQDGIINPSAEGAVLTDASEAFALELEAFLAALEKRVSALRQDL